MLRNIPKILPPELVKTMMEMGHSDVLILADANFPGTAHAKKMNPYGRHYDSGTSESDTAAVSAG